MKLRLKHKETGYILENIEKIFDYYDGNDMKINLSNTKKDCILISTSGSLYIRDPEGNCFLIDEDKFEILNKDKIISGFIDGFQKKIIDHVLRC